MGNIGHMHDRTRSTSPRVRFHGKRTTHRLASASALAAFAVGLCVVAGLLACGAPVLEGSANESPRSYPGACTLIGIEEVSAPIDQPTDTVALVARYRFGEGAGSHDPVALHFEIARTRADDLRRHLAAQPTVVCRPGERSAAAPPVVELTPFEGQSGRPMP